MIEVSSVASAQTNLTSGGVAASAGYYPYHGVNAAADMGTTTMSFDDFVDMINPLEHIPVISSVYRAIAGESINPVSRIAGDTLYGGALGFLSAGLAAVGAIGDEVYTASADGQSTSSSVISALFGKDEKTQIADSKTNEKTTQVASLQTPALQSPILQIVDPASIIPPASAPATTVTAEAENEDSVTPTLQTASTNAVAPAADGSAGKGMPLDRTKLPYGGVMDSSMMASAQQNQALALAVAGQNQVMQAQRALRSNRFATTSVPGTTAPASSLAMAATNSAAASNVAASPETQAAIQKLVKELQAMKPANQYKNAVQSTPLPGSTVNITN